MKHGIQTYNNHQSLDSVENFGIPVSGHMISPDMAFKTIMTRAEQNFVDDWDNGVVNKQNQGPNDSHYNDSMDSQKPLIIE